MYPIPDITDPRRNLNFSISGKLCKELELFSLCINEEMVYMIVQNFLQGTQLTSK
jgi:hypothetical protein